MASVALTEVWFHRSENPSSYVKFEEANAVQEQAAASGKIVATPQGRKWITTGETTEDFAIQIEYAVGTDVDVLLGWRGLPLALRDASSRVVWGVVDSVQLTDSPGADLSYVAQVTVSFKQTIGDASV